MKVRVLYNKLSSPFLFLIDRDARPSPSEIEVNYIMVARFDAPDDITPDDVFGIMNLEPETVFDPTSYFRDVCYTSMSVGDIVAIGNEAFLCLPIGWHELSKGGG